MILKENALWMPLSAARHSAFSFSSPYMVTEGGNGRNPFGPGYRQMGSKRGRMCNPPNFAGGLCIFCTKQREKRPSDRKTVAIMGGEWVGIVIA